MAVNGRENDGVPIVDPHIATLYREAATEEPSARLDEAIAREARGTRPIAPARAPLMQRLLAWRLPLVTAAVVVVSASVVVLMLDRGAYYTGVGEDSQSQPLAQARGDAEPQAKEEPGASSERQAANRLRTAPSNRVTGEPRGNDALEQSSRAADARAMNRDASDAPLPPPPAEAVAAAPPTSPPPAAPVAAAEEPRRSRAERALASPRADPKSEEAASAFIAELDKEPAERWIERIQTLRREGRRAEADALLGEFTRRFGDAAVPPALKSHD
jgi:hypothetical protein